MVKWHIDWNINIEDIDRRIKDVTIDFSVGMFMISFFGVIIGILGRSSFRPFDITIFLLYVGTALYTGTILTINFLGKRIVKKCEVSIIRWFFWLCAIIGGFGFLLMGFTLFLLLGRL